MRVKLPSGGTAAEWMPRLSELEDLIRHGGRTPGNMKITRFEDVEAWKAARGLMGRVYEATKAPPFVEEKDLARQLRRAAVSAMANIAEGFDAGSDPEFRRFLRIARRSLSEVQSHLYVALDLTPVRRSNFTDLYDRATKVKRLLGGFLRYLKACRPNDLPRVGRGSGGTDSGPHPAAPRGARIGGTPLDLGRRT